MHDEPIRYIPLNADSLLDPNPVRLYLPLAPLTLTTNFPMYPVGPTTSTLMSLGALERYAPLAAAWHCSLEDRWKRGLGEEFEKAPLDSCTQGNNVPLDHHRSR